MEHPKLFDSGEGPLAASFRSLKGPPPKREPIPRYIYLGGHYPNIETVAQDLNVNPDTLRSIPMQMCSPTGYAYENAQPILVAEIMDYQLRALSARAAKNGISSDLINIAPVNEKEVKFWAYVFGTEVVNLQVSVHTEGSE